MVLAVTEQILHVEGHRLAALPLNPGAPGRPIILLHGVMASVQFWAANELASLLAPYGPCTALSLPGHYPAAFPAGFQAPDLTAEMMARVLTAAIRQLAGEQPVTLVGHSTGGFAALDIAAHTPDLAGGVISIAGFARGRWTGMLGLYQRLARGDWWARARLRVLLKAGQTSRSLYRYAGRYLVADPARLLTQPGFDALMEAAFPAFRRLSLDALCAYFATMPDVDIGPLLPRITAPTLVLAGECDPIVPPAQSRLIAEQVPQAELVLIPRVGHWPFIEDPAAYRQAVGDWWQRQARG